MVEDGFAETGGVSVQIGQPGPVDAGAGECRAQRRGDPVGQVDVVRGAGRDPLDVPHPVLATGGEPGEQLSSLWDLT